MYSTRLLNKNMVDGNAYITVGDKYQTPVQNPFRQPKKLKDGDKPPVPFQVKMNPTNAENGHFSKLEHPQPYKYDESLKYINTQPLDNRKKGFGTGDAKRRDEFTNTCRTEQYRSTLVKENITVNKGAQKLQDTLATLLETRLNSTAPGSMETSKFATKCSQYDIGRSRVTPFDPKSSRDTHYKFTHKEGKVLGDYKPSSYEFGSGAWSHNYVPPANGGKSETKNFWDKSHLTVSQY